MSPFFFLILVICVYTLFCLISLVKVINFIGLLQEPAFGFTDFLNWFFKYLIDFCPDIYFLPFVYFGFNLIFFSSFSRLEWNSLIWDLSFSDISILLSTALVTLNLGHQLNLVRVPPSSRAVEKFSQGSEMWAFIKLLSCVLKAVVSYVLFFIGVGGIVSADVHSVPVSLSCLEWEISYFVMAEWEVSLIWKQVL